MTFPELFHKRVLVIVVRFFSGMGGYGHQAVVVMKIEEILLWIELVLDLADSVKILREECDDFIQEELTLVLVLVFLRSSRVMVHRSQY